MAKPCTTCGVCDKAPGKQKCVECLLAGLEPYQQEQAALARRNMVPTALRRATVPKDLWPKGRRWCADCQSFRRLQDCSGSRCKTCLGVANQNAYLMRTYQIHGRPFTTDDFNALFEEQDGRCRTCGRRSVTKRLAVDHDHDTGQVRGLLCPGDPWGCNVLLGRIGSLAKARAFVRYLEENFAESVIKS